MPKYTETDGIELMKIAISIKYILVAVCLSAALSFACTAQSNQMPGSGTLEDPFIIQSAQTLAELSQASQSDSFEGMCFALGNDIVLNDSRLLEYNDYGVLVGLGEEVQLFTPIGTKEFPFMGTFDGAGYSVSGLCVDTEADYAGIFGYTEGAVIKNLTIYGSFISGSVYVGAAVAYAGENTELSGLNVSGSVVGIGEKLGSYIGGVVGFVSAGSSVSDCVCYSTIGSSRAFSVYCGGIAGLNMGSVDTCSFGGEIYGEAATFMAAIGGIAGGNRGNISRCNSNGSMVGAETSAVVTDCYTGGIAGENADNGTITDCVNNSPVICICYNFEDNVCTAGGIVGLDRGAGIKRCANYAVVEGDYVYVGGIAGAVTALENNTLVEDCLNAGSLIAGAGTAGGVVGYTSASYGYTTLFRTSVNAGTVDAVTPVGFAGEPVGDVEFENCLVVTGASVPTDGNVGSITYNSFVSGTSPDGFDSTGEIWLFNQNIMPGLAAEYSVKNTSTIVADKVIILTIGQPLSITGDGEMRLVGASLEKAGAYDTAVFFSGTESIFAPAPKNIKIAVVTDPEKPEILNIKDNTTQESGIVLGNVTADLYLPGVATAKSIAAVYDDSRLSNVVISDAVVADGISKVEFVIPASAVSSVKSICIYVFDDMVDVSPICASKMVNE